MLSTVLLALSVATASTQPSLVPPAAEGKNEYSQVDKGRAGEADPTKPPPEPTRPISQQTFTDGHKTKQQHETTNTDYVRPIVVEVPTSGWSITGSVVTAVATIALVWVAILQFRWQRRYVKDTRKIADAAKTSADTAEATLRGLERPHLFIEIDASSLSVGQLVKFFSDGGTREPVVLYRMTNHGRGPAIVKSRRDVFRCFSVLPAEPQFDFPEEGKSGKIVSDPAWHMVVGPTITGPPLGVRYEKADVDYLKFISTKAGAIPYGIHLYGEVLYEDIFGNA